VNSGQFCDSGPKYRPIVFFSDDAQRERAEASKRALGESHRFPRVLTTIAPASTFWVGEAWGTPPK
jgi:peptide-methionine (S)-S-oxide reductase